MGPWQRERGDALTIAWISSEGSANVRRRCITFTERRYSYSLAHIGTRAASICIATFVSIYVTTTLFRNTLTCYVYLFV